jgi:hypothetical protein
MRPVVFLGAAALLAILANQAYRHDRDTTQIKVEVTCEQIKEEASKNGADMMTGEAGENTDESIASGMAIGLTHRLIETSFGSTKDYTTDLKDYMKRENKYLEENERFSYAKSLTNITAATPRLEETFEDLQLLVAEGNGSHALHMLPSPGRNVYNECPHRGFLVKHTCNECENTEKALDFSRRRHPRIRINTVFYKYRHQPERYILAWLRPVRDPHKLVCLARHQVIEYRCDLDQDICVIYGIKCEVMHDPVTGHILFSDCKMYV